METDVTLELNDDLANWHQQLINVLRWACELSPIDILLENFVVGVSHVNAETRPSRSGVLRLCLVLEVTSKLDIGVRREASVHR